MRSRVQTATVTVGSGPLYTGVRDFKQIFEAKSRGFDARGQTVRQHMSGNGPDMFLQDRVYQWLRQAAVPIYRQLDESDRSTMETDQCMQLGIAMQTFDRVDWATELNVDYFCRPY